MKLFASVSAAFLVVLGSAGCDASTEPEPQDPAGTKASEVTVSGPCTTESLECGALLVSGASATLQAQAKLGSQDVTSQCDFVWRASPAYVRIRVNPTTETAIVTREWFTVYAGAITITATCNGVSGPYNVFFGNPVTP
jgi:hypothetical protein